MSHTPLLCCPLDGLPLVLQNSQWCCANGHGFDVARQGYVNLLPVQNKRTLDPGDSKEMVVARRDFLDGGWYQPIADKAVELLKPYFKAGAVLLDAGCGEGYYLDHLAKAAGQDVYCVGNDISKHAIVAACRRDKQHTWLVASNKLLPVPPLSVDVLMCLFGFPVYAEFKRVLKDDGVMLLVDSAEQHMRELREIIYPSIKEKQDRLVEQASVAGFKLQNEVRITFPLHGLGKQQLYSLLLMTPHFFKAKAEGREKILKMDSFDLTADVWLRLFSKE